MELGYNHPMGPLELGDIVGLNVRLDILEGLREELGERFRPTAPEAEGPCGQVRQEDRRGSTSGGTANASP